MSKAVGKNSAELNPRTKSYEFFGPPGTLFITLTVPITIYSLFFACSESSGGCPPPLATFPERITESLTDLDWWKGLWDTQASLLYLAWYAFCVVAWYILPGDRIEGVELRTGGRLAYKINGMFIIYSVINSRLTRQLQHSQPSLPQWALPVAGSFVLDQSASVSSMTNGSGSLLPLCSCLLFKPLLVTPPHSAQVPSLPSVETVATLSMTCVVWFQRSFHVD
jgi:hypothetical protein